MHVIIWDPPSLSLLSRFEGCCYPTCEGVHRINRVTATTDFPVHDRQRHDRKQVDRLWTRVLLVNEAPNFDEPSSVSASRFISILLLSECLSSSTEQGVLSGPNLLGILVAPSNEYCTVTS